MHVRMINLIIGFTILCSIAFIGNIHAEVPNKEKKDLSIDFANVDIVILCEWDGTDKLEQVDIIDKTKSKMPRLIIYKNGHKQSELMIIKGAKILVFDHISGKLLKTYVPLK